jgi:hypothetical protein
MTEGAAGFAMRPTPDLRAGRACAIIHDACLGP